MNALVRPESAHIRFGFTVGKRNARRSVDRVLVKRILREAARHAAPELLPRATQAVDVSLRLKRPLPRAGRDIGLATLKSSLRADADALLAELGRQLARLELAPAELAPAPAAEPASPAPLDHV